MTVVGRSSAVGALTDEDAVDLWREIPHPKSSQRVGGAERA